MLALVREGIEQLGRILGAAAEFEDPQLRLLALGDAYIEFALAYPHHYTTLFHSLPKAGHLDDYREVFEEMILTLHPLAQVVAEITGDPAHAMDHAMVLWSSLHGLVMLQLSRRLEFIGSDFERVRQLMRQQLPLMLCSVTSAG